MKLTYLLIADCQSRSLPETQSQRGSSVANRTRIRAPKIQEGSRCPDTRIRLAATNVVRASILMPLCRQRQHPQQ